MLQTERKRDRMLRFLKMAITSEDTVSIFIESGVKLLAIFLFSILLVWLSDFSIRKAKEVLLQQAQGMKPNFIRISSNNFKNRTDTLASVLNSLVRAVVFVLALISVLSIFKVDIGPLVAGAGIVGIVITLGTQNLVKDLITGSFILVENQFDVGDVVTINNFSGTVEKMNWRTTVLRSLDGNVHIIPNGQINIVTVQTEGWSRVVLDVPIAQNSDLEHVTQLLQSIGETMRQEDPWKELMFEDLHVLGVESFDENSMIVRSLCKTVPGKQWMVLRELRRRVQATFAKEGIGFSKSTRPGI
jgi:moderate conductance mechanosensitive channel